MSKAISNHKIFLFGRQSNGRGNKDKHKCSTVFLIVISDLLWLANESPCTLDLNIWSILNFTIAHTISTTNGQEEKYVL